MENYEVYIEIAPGQFEPAPNPPPPEWRERKGVCKTCGEKVFVKAGTERCFWTHGKGKTCVPRPNAVSAAIEASESKKNAGASTEGDEELKARFVASQEQAPEPKITFTRFRRSAWAMPEPPKKKEFKLECIVKEGVSLGWVEASLVVCGALTEIKQLDNLPEVGAKGLVAIHYKGQFSPAAYEQHVAHAKERFPDVVLPSYEEIRGQRKNYYWATADYEIAAVNGARVMRVSNVKLLSTHVFRISDERMFWTIDSSDSKLISMNLQ